MTKKILIVGGSGFLGLNLAKKLDSSKFKIFLLCKNNKSKPYKLKKAKYLYCNLQNISKLRKVLNINFNIIQIPNIIKCYNKDTPFSFFNEKPSS